MDFDDVMMQIGRWGGTLKFFPSDVEARVGIAEQISAMAGDEDQVRWLVSRISQLFTDWPGMLEVRAVFCTRYKAKDGVEAALGSASPAFASLCADEHESLAQISAPRSRKITGEIAPVSADIEMQELIARCAAPKNPLAGVKRATDDDIKKLKAVQDANRKESQPSV